MMQEQIDSETWINWYHGENDSVFYYVGRKQPNGNHECIFKEDLR